MKRAIFPAIVAAAFIGAAAPVALAQSACRENRTRGAALPAEASGCRALQLPSPDANAPVRGRVPAGFVTADKDDSQVQIQAGKRLLLPASLGQVSLNASATAPLADGPLTPLAELRGVLPGTALELSLTSIRWPTVRTSRDLLAWCREKIPNEPCTRANIFDNHRELKEEYLRVAGFRRPLLFQATASASYDEHDFVDETTLAEGSQRRVPFTLSGTFGGFLGATLVTVNGRYERRFEDGDEVEICSPVGVGSAERCETAHLGESESTSKTVLTGQVRRFLSASTAVNLRVVHRLDDETWSVEAPFYFIPNGDGALIGGIVPGWSSQNEKFTIRLFVGRAFGLRAN